VSTRRLGNSDLNITPVGFGAWAIGGTGYDFAWGKQDDADSIAAVHRSLELGVNWIDTAPVYGTGHSEEIVASALKEWRGSRPYVFTKCVMRWDEKGRVMASGRIGRRLEQVCGISGAARASGPLHAEHILLRKHLGNELGTIANVQLGIDSPAM
jgi:aryl-alcohol dehydrogenase-like predicted oxidoreductase